MFGWVADGSVSTVSPFRSLSARLTPAPPTAAVLVTAAPFEAGNSSVEKLGDERAEVGTDDRHERLVGAP